MCIEVISFSRRRHPAPRTTAWRVRRRRRVPILTIQLAAILLVPVVAGGAAAATGPIGEEGLRDSPSRSPLRPREVLETAGGSHEGYGLDVEPAVALRWL
jgi:hypothetical protein